MSKKNSGIGKADGIDEFNDSSDINQELSSRSRSTLVDRTIVPPAATRLAIEADLLELAEIGPIPGQRVEPDFEANPEPLPLGLRRPMIIGMTGLPHAGKDVLVDYLEANYTGIRRCAFSDVIIAEVNRYLGEQGLGEHQIGPENKSVPEYRRLLQDWGIGRAKEDPLYLARGLEQVIAAAKADPETELIVITGARMPGDFDYIENHLGAEVWRAVRPGNSYQAEHPVEIAASERPVARELLNDVEGDLTAFVTNIEAAINDQRSVLIEAEPAIN